MLRKAKANADSAKSLPDRSGAVIKFRLCFQNDKPCFCRSSGGLAECRSVDRLYQGAVQVENVGNSSEQNHRRTSPFHPREMENSSTPPPHDTLNAPGKVGHASRGSPLVRNDLHGLSRRQPVQQPKYEIKTGPYALLYHSTSTVRTMVHLSKPALRAAFSAACLDFP